MIALSPRALTAVLLLAASTTAQQVLVVDQQNGPGTDFVDLPAAIAAASPGATIQVRPGGYTGFVTDKGIQILGGPGTALTRLVNPRASMFGVSGLPAGQTFLMRDIAISGVFFGSPFIGTCQGRVVLDGVDSSAMSITNSAQVELRRCGFVLGATNSTVSIDEHDVTGSLFPPFSSGAVILDQSTCFLTDSFIQGSLGAPAITMTNSDLSISMRRPGSLIASGQGTTQQIGSISGTGTVRLDPNSNLQGFDPNSTSPISPAIFGPTVQVVDLPSLRTGGGAIGETFTSEIAGTAGRPYLVLIGSPVQPVSFPGIGGELWMRDPFVLSNGVFGSNQVEPVLSTIPNASILIGLPIVRQILSLDQGGGFQLSNPGTYVIRP